MLTRLAPRDWPVRAPDLKPLNCGFCYSVMYGLFSAA